MREHIFMLTICYTSMCTYGEYAVHRQFSIDAAKFCSYTFMGRLRRGRRGVQRTTTEHVRQHGRKEGEDLEILGV